MIVADTSLIASLLLDSPNTPAAEAVLDCDPYWISPGLWRYEFNNVLSTQIRFAGLAIERAIEMFEEAGTIVMPADMQVSSTSILRLAVEKKLSAYDAEFLALAIALDVQVVTFDKGLLKAADGIAVTPQIFVAG